MVERIGIVVPVYNVEAYLDRCVSSIVAQTYQDFLLILVNDGSSDGSGAICDNWAKKDDRIQVIHQENGGLSAARNAGMDLLFHQAEFQWLTFVDSDDWLHPRMLEVLLRAVKDTGTDIGVCAYLETKEEGWTSDQDLEQWECWSAEDFYRNRFVDATIACAKLYRKEYFLDVRFPKGKIHEDEFVTYQLLFRAEKLTFVPAPLYAYFVNPAGITKSGWSPRRLDAWEAYEQQITFFEEKNMQELVHFRYREYLEGGMRHLAAAESNPGEYSKEIRFIEKRMRSVIRRAWKRGSIAFWADYDMLYRFYPLKTRLYRPILEWKVRRQKRKEKQD